MQLPFVLAQRFVADETLEGTLPVVHDLNAKGLHVALDLLGEHVADRDVAAAARDTYIDLVRRLAALSSAGDGPPAARDGQAASGDGQPLRATARPLRATARPLPAALAPTACRRAACATASPSSSR